MSPIWMCMSFKISHSEVYTSSKSLVACYIKAKDGVSCNIQLWIWVFRTLTCQGCLVRPLDLVHHKGKSNFQNSDPYLNSELGPPTKVGLSNNKLHSSDKSEGRKQACHWLKISQVHPLLPNPRTKHKFTTLQDMKTVQDTACLQGTDSHWWQSTVASPHWELCEAWYLRKSQTTLACTCLLLHPT